jgi:hypothetical protein
VPEQIAAFDINASKHGVHVFAAEDFFMLAHGRRGVWIQALTHSVYFTITSIYSTRLTKN